MNRSLISRSILNRRSAWVLAAALGLGAAAPAPAPRSPAAPATPAPAAPATPGAPGAPAAPYTHTGESAKLMSEEYNSTNRKELTTSQLPPGVKKTFDMETIGCKNINYYE